MAFAAMLNLIAKYSQRNLLVGSALQLMAFLYPRPGELRQADWSEFDLKNATWTIPAERTEDEAKHVKPLPTQALAILKNLHEITGPAGYTFPAVGKTNRPMSENTMNVALRN